MKIAMDVSALLTPRTGVGNYTLKLTQQLQNMLGRRQVELHSNRPLANDVPLRGEVVYAKKASTRFVWMHTQLPVYFEQQPVALAHFPNNSAPVRCAIPYILTIHDASLYRFPQHHPLKRHLAIRALLPQAAKRAAAIITPTQHAKRELAHDLNLPAEQFHVIHEAAGERFRPITDPDQRTRIRQKYHLPDQFILFVGTLEPRKNLKRLAKALLKLRGMGLHQPLVLVGKAGWKLKQFSAELADLASSNNLITTGYVPDEDLPTLYSLATCLAFPSLHEGFGLPPLEAMACGTPVLTSKHTAMPEVCGNAAFIIDPYSVRDIAQGLHKITTDNATQSTLRANGLRHTAHYSWERTAQQTLAVYQHVLQHHKFPIPIRENHAGQPI